MISGLNKNLFFENMQLLARVVTVKLIDKDKVVLCKAA
jgi:hypothetical protein